MIINREPITGSKNGEIRYYCFYSPYGKKENRFFVYKVRCLRKRYDNINKYYIFYCEVLETVYGKEYKGKTIADFSWQLQTSVEDCFHLAIRVLFEKGEKGFYTGGEII